MAHRPNARQILLKRADIGKDELVDKILTQPDSPEAKLWPKCQDIFESRVKRGYVEASLMSGENFDKISEVLEIPIEVLKLYEKTCFDISGYDRLSKIDLLDKERDKDILVMKMWAMNQGLQFIEWRLGKKVEVSPLEGLSEMFTMCLYKSKEALFNGNAKTASIESTKWAKLSLDIARLLKIWVLDSDLARKDLELAIKEVVPDFTSLDDIIAEGERLNAEQPQRDDSEAKQIIEEALREQREENE